MQYGMIIQEPWYEHPEAFLSFFSYYTGSAIITVSFYLIFLVYSKRFDTRRHGLWLAGRVCKALILPVAFMPVLAFLWTGSVMRDWSMVLWPLISVSLLFICTCILNRQLRWPRILKKFFIVAPIRLLILSVPCVIPFVGLGAMLQGGLYFFNPDFFSPDGGHPLFLFIPILLTAFSPVGVNCLCRMRGVGQGAVVPFRPLILSSSVSAVLFSAPLIYELFFGAFY